MRRYAGKVANTALGLVAGRHRETDAVFLEVDGRRLAASYANYLILNGAVLMPAYGDRADDAAREVLAAAYPDREIVQVPCRPLIWQNGSLHCITMQLPQGLVAA